MTTPCPPAAPLECSESVDLLAVASGGGGAAAASDPYASFPAVSGEQLAFVTEGEVWVATLPREDGSPCVPRRITDHSSGEASRLCFSPDGSLLAYSLAAANYQEVYCCAAGGGRSRRLTYLGASPTHVVGWSRDGHAVVFASAAGCAETVASGAGSTALWQVSVTGGAPVPLGLGEAESLVLQPGGGPGVLIGRHTGDPAVDQWKRYRGGRNGQLWLDVAGTGSFSKLQIAVDGGSIGAPLWLRDRIFFVSDHAGRGDLHSCDLTGSDLIAHALCRSHPEFYVRRPASDGQTLVYAAGGRLYRADVDAIFQGSCGSTEIVMRWCSPRQGLEPYLCPALDTLDSYSLSPNGAWLALATRGQAFALGVFNGPAQALPPHTEAAAAAGRNRLVAHLADGLRVLVVSDYVGEDAITVHWTDGSHDKPMPLSIDAEKLGRLEELCPNPHHSGVVALTNHRKELLLLAIPDKDDAEEQEARLQELLGAQRGGGGGKKKGGRVPPNMERKREITAVDLRRVDCCAHENGIDDLAWSPCGGWLAYSNSVSFEHDTIKLCELSSGRCHTITNPISSDISPSFDPAGKYLYFIGTRDYEPVYDRHLTHSLTFPSAQRPCLLTLQSSTPSPLLPMPRAPIDLDEVASDEEGDDFLDDDEFFDENGKLYPELRGKFVPKPASIDLEGIANRVVSLPVPTGIYDRIVGLEGNRVMFLSCQSRSRRVGFGDVGSDIDSDDEDDEHAGKISLFNLRTLQVKTLQIDGPVFEVEVSCDGRFMAVLTQEDDGEMKLFVSRAGEEPGAAVDDSEDEADGPEFGPLTGAVDVDGRVVLRAQPAVEWPQLFHEAWRAVRDGYAEPIMGGVDWSAIRTRYAGLLPRASTRAEVSDIILEMLAELGKSHVSEHAGLEGPRPAPELMPACLGAEFIWDHAVAGYRCTHIVCGDRWDPLRGGPLAKPGVNVAVGDVLMKVNGLTLSEVTPPAKALVGCAGQETALVWKRNVVDGTGSVQSGAVDAVANAMEMLFLNDATSANRETRADANVGAPAGRQPSSAAKKKKKRGGGGNRGGRDEASVLMQGGGSEWRVTVRTLGSDRYARYVDEIAARREHVHSTTTDRVGYMHIPDCERLGFAEFHRHFTTESRRDALVLDVRGNEGGHISELLIEKLSQHICGWEVPRWGQPYCVPSMACTRTMVLLCNEATCSDGELFVHRFQQLGLGPVIGTRTWGGVMVSDESEPLIDAGSVGFPSATVFAFDPAAEGDGHGAVTQLENQGAVPDVEVPQPPRRHSVQPLGQQLCSITDVQLAQAVDRAVQMLERIPGGSHNRPPAILGWRMEPRSEENAESSPDEWPFGTSSFDRRDGGGGGSSGGRRR